MNQELIDMARKAGLDDDVCPLDEWEPVELIAFAALVAAAEREACAKLCDVLAVHPEYASEVTKLAAAAIRARGETE